MRVGEALKTLVLKALVFEIVGNIGHSEIELEITIQHREQEYII